MPLPTARSDPFRAIADPTRRAILARLRMGPVAVNTLAASFEQSRPAISKHLRVLREAGLVTEERRGRERFYRLQADPLREVVDWVQTNQRFWRTSLDRLKQHVEDTP